MPTLSLRRRIALLLLGVTLVLPWRAMAGPRREPVHRTPTATEKPRDLAGRLWSYLASLWAETGCYIDPNGRCVTNPSPGATGQADSGCYIDPNGCRVR